MILDYKQSTYLEYLERYALVEAKVEGEIVRLLRKDGTEFRFTAKGADGIQGPKGDKGPTGERGDSAYDIAVRTGLTNSNLKGWLQSLKGVKGDKGPTGSAGKNGTNGLDGTAPNFETSFEWIDPDKEPYLNVNNDNNICRLHLALPKNPKGEKGKDSAMPCLNTGVVTQGDSWEGAAEIVNGLLNITLPCGFDGPKGKTVKGLDAIAPDITMSVVWIDYDEEPRVETEDIGKELGKAWTKKVTFFIPKGEIGDKGPTGEQGKSKATGVVSTLKVINDISIIQNPPEGFCCIRFDEDGRTSYGFSWRTNKETLQLVHTLYGYNQSSKDSWRYRKGLGTGLLSEDITKGWIIVWSPYQKKYYTLY